MNERVVTRGDRSGGRCPRCQSGREDRDLPWPQDGLPNPWFIGFAPAEDPTIAIAVFFEASPELGKSTSGGGVAAPLAGDPHPAVARGKPMSWDESIPTIRPSSMDAQTALTDRYQITSHLARGGMADVYEGRDNLLNRRVAIKVLHSQYSTDEAFVKRFRREAQAAANLSHPNIVGIYDWGQAQNTYFIVMELVDGRSLRDVLRSEGALLPRRATEITAEVAAALSVAHQAGLVHHDVKPGNILLAKDGTVKVTDFGIARAWDDSQELTRTGAVIGTATYFSPGAGSGCGCRCPERCLFPWRGALRDAHRAPAVHRRQPDVGCLPTRLDRGAASEFAQFRRLAVTRRGGGQGDAKGPGSPVPNGRRDPRRPISVLKGEEVGMPPLHRARGGTGQRRRRNAGDVGHPRTSGHCPPRMRCTADVEEEPSSQMPFILTAFGLLLALGGLIFLLFQLAGGGEEEPTLVEVPNVTGISQAEALHASPAGRVLGHDILRVERHGPCRRCDPD